MNLRFIDWIWHVRGSVPLAHDLSNDDAFDRLDPLFRQYGTRHQRTHDTLRFTKRDQAAQDKMSIFDGGALQIERGVTGPVLRYDLGSRALLFCFLAPLLFLAFAQAAIALGKHENAATEAAGKAGKTPDPAKAAKKKVVVPLNPVDKFLGAPEPDKGDADKPTGRGKKPSATPAYVFAAIFATLYVVGRILEDRLIARLFRRSLRSV